MSSYTRPIIYLSEITVNGTVTGVTLLTRTRISDGLNFHPFQAFAKIINATNIQAPAVINIGTNPTTFNNVVAGQNIGDGPVGVIQLTSLADLSQLPEDTNINIRVVTAATPIPSTTATLTFRVLLVGVEV